MACIALMEGVIIALIIPLLQLALGDAMIQKESGFLGEAIGIFESFLGLFSLEPTIGVVLLVIVSVFFMQGVVRYLQMRLAWQMVKQYDLTLVHKLAKSYLWASWPFFISQKAGHLVSSVGEETGRSAAALQFTLQFLAQFFIILFYIGISFLISWKITIMGIVLGLVASAFLKKFIGRMEVIGAEMSKANSEFQSATAELFASAKMIKASATQRQALKIIDERAYKKSHLRYISQVNGSLIPSFYFPLVIAMLALIFYIATLWWQIGFATLLLYVYIFYRLIPALSSLHSAYEQALIYIPAKTVVQSLKKEARALKEKYHGIPFIHLKKDIAFSNVDLWYEEKKALSLITLTIKKGESAAFVGVSGAGKTSLVDLLLGLFVPQKGTILIDGVDLHDYNLASWRRKIGYLSQDMFLFHDTIYKNLIWISGDAGEKDIKKAIKASYADEFIATLPQGLHTLIGDRGVKLSGGQRQRIILARVLLQNPEIIIFDEAFNALDADSEQKIKQATKELFRDKTKIFISHRLASIKDVNTIYVMDKGRIVEEGRWDTLTKKKGILKELNEKQH